MARYRQHALWLIGLAAATAALLLAVGGRPAPAISPVPAPATRPPVAVALANQALGREGRLQGQAMPGAVSEDGACLGTPVTVIDDVSGVRHECVGTPSAGQNGEIRSHRFSAASGWALDIRVAAGQVLDVVASRNGDITASCEADACIGLRIGLPDQDAVQTLDLDGLPLTDADGRTQTLSATLRSAPGYGCVGEAVVINHSDGRYQHFCPHGGIGTVYDEAGTGTLTARSLDGATIRVTLDADDHVIGVDHDGYRCRAAACTGVLALLADPLGTRSIRFAGTLLVAADTSGSSRSLTLNGRLDLPQESLLP